MAMVDWRDLQLVFTTSGSGCYCLLLRWQLLLAGCEKIVYIVIPIATDIRTKSYSAVCSIIIIL